MTPETVASAVLGYLLSVVAATASCVFILVGPGLILAFVMNALTWFVRRQAYQVFGARFYPLLFGWLGSIVHELGHALLCPLFGHTIEDMQLFSYLAPGGRTGYVRHSYDRGSLYQTIGNFFISIGPIILGTLVTYYASRFLLGPQVFQAVSLDAVHRSPPAWGAVVGEIGRSALAVVRSLFTWENVGDWRFYLFLYVAFSVGSSITLSRADVKGAWKGFVAFVGLIFLFNLATVWLSGRAVEPGLVMFSQAYGSFYAVMAFALIVNALFALVLLPLWFLR